jgi:hypothetical protein
MTTAKKGSYERYFGPYGRRQLPTHQIDSLMTEAELKSARRQAWWRIAHTFAGARTARGRRATPCYILGVDERLSSLAHHIMAHMSSEAKEEIFAARNLPEKYEFFMKGSPTEVAERVVYELIMRELTELRNHHEIYFMEVGGEWRIIPSALGEYYQLVRRTVVDPKGRADRRSPSAPTILGRLPKAVRSEILTAA